MLLRRKQTKDIHLGEAQRLHEQSQRAMNRAVDLLKMTTGCSESVAVGIVANIASFVMSDYASRVHGYDGKI